MHIRHLGCHPSRVATKVLQKGDSYTLGPMGWFELIQGKFKYHIHFGEQFLDADDKASTSETVADDTPSHSCEDAPPRKKLKVGCDSTPVQKTLHSFAPDSESSLELCTWREVDTVLVFQYGSPANCSKAASFDLDNTIVETSSGRKFATGPTDWKLMTGVSNKLKSLSKDGYKIVLLSNQLGISKGKPTKAEFKQKVKAIALKLQIPLLLLASTAKDMYRKPCTGMWDHLEKFENGGIELDMKSSFYVGDAAGRSDKWMPGTYHPL